MVRDFVSPGFKLGPPQYSCKQILSSFLSQYSSLTDCRLPLIIDRMGRMETIDRKLFCLAALDFRHQLNEDSQRRTFLATFQAVAQPDSPYADLIAHCN